jgi:glycosyltransferase involved in cell wall biosynthesis
MPTYNRCALLARAMQAILDMRGADHCEIVVVDDGSTDETPAVLADLAARHPNVKPVRRENGGTAAARNTAIKHATRDYLLCMDDDVIPDPGLLEAHGERLLSGWDISQGSVVWHESVADDPLARFIESRGMQFRLDNYADGDVVSYKNVYTANVALSAADARAVGCLDSAFGWKRYGFEDTAFAWRLARGGKRAVYTAAARARHLHPWTGESLLRREYSVGFGLALAGKQYPEMAADLGYDKVKRDAGWLLPPLAIACAVGLPKLFGADFRRRVALKQSFLRGFRDARKELEPSGKTACVKIPAPRS